jgi:hypothetical protein
MPRVSLPSSVVVLIAFPISYLGNISGEQLWSETHNDNADDEDCEDDDIAYDAEVESMLWYDANTAMPEPLEWDTKHSTIAKVIITAPPPAVPTTSIASPWPTQPTPLLPSDRCS